MIRIRHLWLRPKFQSGVCSWFLETVNLRFMHFFGYDSNSRVATVKFVVRGMHSTVSDWSSELCMFCSLCNCSSSTNRLITSKDVASVQLNVGHVDENGVYTGQFTTFALCGFVRAQVRCCVLFSFLSSLSTGGMQFQKNHLCWSST